MNLLRAEGKFNLTSRQDHFTYDFDLTKASRLLIYSDIYAPVCVVACTGPEFRYPTAVSIQTQYTESDLWFSSLNAD